MSEPGGLGDLSPPPHFLNGGGGGGGVSPPKIGGC